MTECIEACKKAEANWVNFKTEYGMNWPSYCWSCRGKGTRVEGEPGAVYRESCDECVTWGKCPRCHEIVVVEHEGVDKFYDAVNLWIDKQLPCPRCGWNWGRGEGDAISDGPECHCWEQEDGRLPVIPFGFDLTGFARDVHRVACEKGWWDNPRGIPVLLCNLHREVSEAFDVYAKNGSLDELTVELADVAIRIFDMCVGLNLDLETALTAKHEYNKTRP